MKVDTWINNLKELRKVYTNYVNKNLIIKNDLYYRLVNAHLSKSDHDLNFVDFLLKRKAFFDWIIVGLYFAVYHAALALVCNKGYRSKNHNATMCFIIKNYSGIGEEDIKFVNELALTKKDIVFYSELKNERRKASYSTKFDKDKQYIGELALKSKTFITKVKSILD